jgi:hypothetical protein
MNNYPKEWPGFRVTIGGRNVRRGGIVEAVAIHVDHEGAEIGCCRLAARILSHGTGRATTQTTDGWPGVIIRIGALEPLTPAARAWLREAHQ